MLTHLTIKNVALIGELELDFADGLNILSGETGAGKSILIDAINFVLGERAAKDLIRSGEQTAEVTALMSVSSPAVKQAAAALDIDADDGEILLYRSLTDQGRNVCKINGKTATAAMLKELSNLLIDIHGQHEHQSLLNPARHIDLLDRFGGDVLSSLKEELAELFIKYKAVIGGIKALNGAENGAEKGDRDEKIAIYEFQIKELETAKLSAEEEEELLEKRKVLANFEKINEKAAQAAALMRGGQSAGVTDRLWKAYNNMAYIADFDESVAELAAELESVCNQADEIARSITDYYDDIERDPEETERVEARLDAIHKIKRKYGGSVESALDHLEKTRAKLDKLINSEGELNRLNAEKATLGKEAMRLCAAVSEARKSAAESLSADILAVLTDLGMSNAQFSISVEKKEGFGAGGFDKVEFLISPNPGEPLKPLAKIASGGEMSRVMLALKTALAKADIIETFIFDEIDTGVSGRTAQKVAEKLGLLGQTHQILCVTHLPQIAAMGDANYLIEKGLEEATGRTTTTVTPLRPEGVTRELARLTGGAEITAATLTAAAEMRKQAEKLKGAKG